MASQSWPCTVMAIKLNKGDTDHTVLGHFGHGHFGLGPFGQDISATDVSATENAKGGHFGQNHKLWVGDGIKYYDKCSKISNTLKLRTPKIIAENIFQNILKNRTLTFFGKVNF